MNAVNVLAESEYAIRIFYIAVENATARGGGSLVQDCRSVAL
jgi:hypothetical protein